jgi:hypothetical protein
LRRLASGWRSFGLRRPDLSDKLSLDDLRAFELALHERDAVLGAVVADGGDRLAQRLGGDVGDDVVAGMPRRSTVRAWPSTATRRAISCGSSGIVTLTVRAVSIAGARLVMVGFGLAQTCGSPLLVWGQERRWPPIASAMARCIAMPLNPRRDGSR